MGFSNFAFVDDAHARNLITNGRRVEGVVFTSDGEEHRLAADLVVGCDGRGSLLRTQAGLKLNRLPTHYSILWFKMPAPDRLRDTCRMMMYASSTGMGISYTSWDNRLQFALVQIKGERRSLSTADWAEQMAGPVPPWLGAHIR